MTDNLQYLRNRDLRELISRMVGVEPGTRYEDDHGAGMPKVVVVEVARELDIERVDDRDLEELYRGICDTLGVERPQSSGKLWGLRREVLKEIVRELQSVDESEKKLVADGGEEVGRATPQPRIVGKSATVRLAVVTEYVVEIEMPPDGDAAKQADLELFLQDRFGDYDEKDVVHAEIEDEEPLYEDDFESPEDWPNYE